MGHKFTYLFIFIRVLLYTTYLAHGKERNQGKVRSGSRNFRGERSRNMNSKQPVVVSGFSEMGGKGRSREEAKKEDADPSFANQRKEQGQAEDEAEIM